MRLKELTKKITKIKEKRRYNIPLKEKIIEKLLFTSASFSIIIVFLIFIFIFKEGIPAFSKISLIEFFTGTNWQPTSMINPEFGTIPLVYGTLSVTVIAMAIAIPFGIAIAVYIAEVSHPIEREILKPVIEILASIPSVVYGFFALVTLATWIQQITGTNFRLNALNGGIILAIMAIPTIVSLAEDTITSVPKEYKEASLALGASRWETIRNAILPSSTSGILASILLGFGRVIGETMAVMMATGNAATSGSY